MVERRRMKMEDKSKRLKSKERRMNLENSSLVNIYKEYWNILIYCYFVWNNDETGAMHTIFQNEGNWIIQKKRR